MASRIIEVSLDWAASSRPAQRVNDWYDLNLGVQFPLFEDDVQDGRLKEICEQTMPDTTYHKYKKQWHKMIKKTLEALRQESAAGVPYSYQTDSLDTAYRSLSTTSSSEAEFGSTDGAGLILDPRTRLINKIKEQVIKYAVMAWHEKFQRIYPINGCESYSLKGTLTQRWQGSGRIYLSHKRITVIADSYELVLLNLKMIALSQLIELSIL